MERKTRQIGWSGSEILNLLASSSVHQAPELLMPVGSHAAVATGSVAQPPKAVPDLDSLSLYLGTYRISVLQDALFPMQYA